MPSYAPPKPVTKPKRIKINYAEPALADHWLERTKRLSTLLASMRHLHSDDLWLQHIDRAQAHVILLRNVTRNREYARIYRLIKIELDYAFGLSRPRKIKS